MMLKTLSILGRCLGLQGVTGAKPPRFLGSLYPRLAVGLLALLVVSLTITITPSAQAQELERQYGDINLRAKYQQYIDDQVRGCEEYGNEYGHCRGANDSLSEWLSGFSDEYMILAELYAFGDYGYQQDYAKAIGYYRQGGGSISQYNLGVLYYQGLGVLQDTTEAAEWWSKAALRGHYPSQFYLARAFETGDGVAQNLVFAHVWYNLASTGGISEAREARNTVQASLSPIQRSEAQRLAKQCLESEYGDCPDPIGDARRQAEAAEAEARKQAEAAEAKQWEETQRRQEEARRQWELLDAQRQATAQRRAEAEAQRLVLLSPFDRGLEAYERWDYATALREFRPLAQSGDAEAQYYLGSMYINGRGVAKNRAKAIEWYQKAADQGHTQAQSELRRLQ